MKSNTLSHLPLALGSGLVSGIGRSLAWCGARYVRSPVTATALILMVAGYGLATTNALYLQPHAHPAPMFLPAGGAQASASRTPPPVEPVVVRSEGSSAPAPAAQPQPVPSPAVSETASSAAPAPSGEPVGNADVAAVQEKLKAMGLFDGMIDGYYGPKTADAIRAFEARFDMEQTGAVTPEIIKAVREAPLSTSDATTAQAAPAAGTTQDEDRIAALIADDPAPSSSTAATSQTAQAQDAPADATMPAVREAGVPLPDLMALADPAAAQRKASEPVLDTVFVKDIQRGLAQLGFLQGPVDGNPGESTAHAIRNFEIFYNYPVSGEVTYALRDRLVEAGAEL